MKKILFIHDQLPAEGISGQVIFLRHFQRLKDMEVHILVPENSYRADIVRSYPPNFIVHTFPLRQFWWPPSRESSGFLLSIRILLLSFLFKKIINEIRPQAVITVLYHYFAIGLTLGFPKKGVVLITFLHDSWIERTNSSFEKKCRIKYGARLLEKSNSILSVSKELAFLYKPKVDEKKLLVHFPIPHGGVKYKLGWKDSFLNSIHIVYAGTVEKHHLIIFEKIANAFSNTSNSFSIVSNGIDHCRYLLEYNPNLILKKAMRNDEVLEYIAENASIVLVNYGLNETQNPFAAASFPSKFVEYSSLGLPTLCIAPMSSPFYGFLKNNNWGLLFSEANIDNMESILFSTKKRTVWESAARQAKDAYKQYFEAEKIQCQFESSISSNS